MEITIPAGPVRNGSLLEVFGIKYRIRFIHLESSEYNLELENVENGISRYAGTHKEGNSNWGKDLNHAKIIE